MHSETDYASGTTTDLSRRQSSEQPSSPTPLRSRHESDTTLSQVSTEHQPHFNPASSASGPSTGDSPITRLPWHLNTFISGAQTTPVRGGALQNGEHSPIGYRQTPHHPGPISMPSFSSMDTNNPISPLQTRGLPPMTPSMPGFFFNAYPETPPLHAHFLSPGLGPFSPGLPVTSPPAFSYNPFFNLAPGAPVNRYPSAQQGGSAQLGTPTTQVFPNNPVHNAYAGPPSRPQNMPQEYFPPANGYNDPGSPTPRVASRSTLGMSMLNAKDRLAPTEPVIPEEGDLERLTRQLTVNGEGHGQGAESPKIRASLDGPRPVLDIPNGYSGERRASFGDIGSGRETKS